MGARARHHARAFMSAKMPGTGTRAGRTFALRQVVDCGVCGLIPATHRGGRCRQCYNYHKRTGEDRSPELIEKAKLRYSRYDPHDLLNRFQSKIVKRPSGCWLWTGTLDGKGYGHFLSFGRLALAHRAAYEFLVGPIPEGHVIDHLCNVRCCVNPEHLEPVTQLENQRRAAERRRIQAGTKRLLDALMNA